jgi:hypothetical protein
MIRLATFILVLVAAQAQSARPLCIVGLYNSARSTPL